MTKSFTAIWASVKLKNFLKKRKLVGKVLTSHLQVYHMLWSFVSSFYERRYIGGKNRILKRVPRFISQQLDHTKCTNFEFTSYHTPTTIIEDRTDR